MDAPLLLHLQQQPRQLQLPPFALRNEVKAS